MYDQPVVEAIREVLRAAASGLALPPYESAFPALGATCA
jgi:hypothetical protein